jgi:hypothetical protein
MSSATSTRPAALLTLLTASHPGGPLLAVRVEMRRCSSPEYSLRAVLSIEHTSNLSLWVRSGSHTGRSSESNCGRESRSDPGREVSFPLPPWIGRLSGELQGEEGIRRLATRSTANSSHRLAATPEPRKDLEERSKMCDRRGQCHSPGRRPGPWRTAWCASKQRGE